MSRYVRSALVVPELGQVALFSSKINVSVFRLQFVLGYNWKQQLPSLDYRWVVRQGAMRIIIAYAGCRGNAGRQAVRQREKTCRREMRTRPVRRLDLPGWKDGCQQHAHCQQ